MKKVTLHLSKVIWDEEYTKPEEQAILFCVDGKPEDIISEDGSVYAPDMVNYESEDKHFTSFFTEDHDELIHDLVCKHNVIWEWSCKA